MNISRRAFLGGAASFGALSGCRMFTAPTGYFAGAGANLTLGVISDIHIDAGKGDFMKFGDTETFEKTLRWFDAQGVDGVVIAGDMADNAMVNQLQCVADAWYRVFPNDRGADGRHVEKLFVYGNHDLEGWNYDKFDFRYFHKESFLRQRITTDPKGAWESVFHEEYAPIWLKSVKGYQFVGAHWSEDRAKSWDGIPAVEPWFAANGAKLDPKKPFFFIQHCHPQGTCYGDEAWCADKGFATRALTPFPNAIAFTGHSHTSLTDERSIWQGAFTSVGTSSLRYGGEDDQYAQRQGMLVRVYDDRVVFVRRDFLHDASLGDDWVLPLPAGESKPYSFPVRRLASRPPAFAKDAKLTVEKVKDGWLLTIPPADAAANRAFRFVIAAGVNDKNGKPALFRRYAAKYNMPRFMAADAVTKYLVKTADLEKDAKPVFKVTPLDAFDNRGVAIG